MNKQLEQMCVSKQLYKAGLQEEQRVPLLIISLMEALCVLLQGLQHRHPLDR